MGYSLPHKNGETEQAMRRQLLEDAARAGVSVEEWVQQVMREKVARAKAARASRQKGGGSLDDFRHAPPSPRVSLRNKTNPHRASLEEEELRHGGRFAAPPNRGSLRSSRMKEDYYYSEDRPMQRRAYGEPQWLDNVGESSVLHSIRRQLQQLDLRFDAISTLNRRERTTRDKLDQLSSRLDDWMNLPKQDAQSIEKRLEHLVASLDDLRASPRIEPHGVEEKIEQIVQNLRDMRESSPPETREMKGKIDQIASRIENIQAGQAPSPLQAQLSLLLSRIDDMRQSSSPEAQNLQEPIERLTASIRDMRAAASPVETAPLHDKLEHITSRMDEWGDLPKTDLIGLKNELAILAGSIERLSPDRLVNIVEGAIAQTAEKVLRAQHAGGLPERLIEPIERLQNDVLSVLREVSLQRGNDRISADIAQITQKLDQLSQVSHPQQTDEILRETDAIKELVARAMQAHPLEGLARQIDILSTQLERFQLSSSERPQDRVLLDAVRDVSDRLERIDPSKAFCGVETNLSAIARIEDKLTEIASGVVILARQSMPIPQINEIADRLERIDRVLDRQDDQPLARLDALTERIDRLGTSLQKIPEMPERISKREDALIDLLEHLRSRMDEVRDPAASAQSFDALQGEITRLAQKLDTMGQLPSLHTLGDNLGNNLLSHMEKLRSELKEVAETSVRKAAETVLGQNHQGQAPQGEDLSFIKKEFNELKIHQNNTEQNTRKSLENLHKMVGSLVERSGHSMAALLPDPALLSSTSHLKNSASTSALEEMSLPVTPSLHHAPLVAKAQQEAVMMSTKQESFRPEGEARQPPRSSSSRAWTDVLGAPTEEDDDAEDIPLAPGSKPGQGAQPLKDAGLAPDPKSDFIAAARRAAQLAAEKGDGTKQQKNTHPAARINTKSLQKTSFIARARKPILLCLAAIVLSIGALKVIAYKQATTQTPATSSLDYKSTGENNDISRTDGNALTTGSVQTSPAPSLSAQEIQSSLPEAATAITNETFNKRDQRLGSSSQSVISAPNSVGSLGDTIGSPSLSSSSVGQPSANQGVMNTTTYNPDLSEAHKDLIASLVIDSNLKKMDRLRDAALGGNIAAYYDIGSRFADGRGVQRDPALALRWLEQAALQGHSAAQYRLGSLYREGKGINKDFNLAYQWFDRAAGQGHVLAMHNTAVMLAEGVGTSAPDYTAAALWFKRAAEYGVKDSQFNVAILFARGLGVSQNLGEAYRWFAIAAIQGDQDAAQKRDELAPRLSKSELTAEQEKVKNFKPSRPNVIVNDQPSWEGGKHGT